MSKPFETTEELGKAIAKATMDFVVTLVGGDSRVAKEAVHNTVRVRMGVPGETVPEEFRECMMERLGESPASWQSYEKSFKAEHPRYKKGDKDFPKYGKKVCSPPPRPSEALTKAITGNTLKFPSPVAKAVVEADRANRALIAATAISEHDRPGVGHRKRATPMEVESVLLANRIQEGPPEKKLKAVPTGKKPKVVNGKRGSRRTGC